MAEPVQDRNREGMALIPDSRFMMGSEGGVFRADEAPRHEVRVTGFYLDTHEVTNAQYNAFLALQKGEGKYKLVATECAPLTQSIVAKGDKAGKLFEENGSKAGSCGLHVELNDQRKLDNPSPAGFDGSNQPVVRATWFEADAYCKAQGKRLPTEAEWEKAAIGPTKGYDPRVIFGTKNGVELKPEEAVYNTDRTADVGSKPANEYGLYDMSGNVWEWVSDWSGADYYVNSPDRDPQGPVDGQYKVLRGGSWYLNSPDLLRVAFRLTILPEVRRYYFGFRCAAPEDFPK